MYEYGIFIQARLGSTRFPKKILAPLAGKRVLDHVLETCKETGFPVFLLTPANDENFFRENFNATVIGGEEHDVLTRFYDAATAHGVKNIVRITSDCPCLPASHISAVVDEHKSNPDKFVTNVMYDSQLNSLTLIPDGYDVEVFSFEMLNAAWKNATDKLEREHVTRWMRNFCSVYVPSFVLVPNEKFSLDTVEDLERIKLNFQLLKSMKTFKVKQA